MHIFRFWQKQLKSFKKIRLKLLEELRSQDYVMDSGMDGCIGKNNTSSEPDGEGGGHNNSSITDYTLMKLLMQNHTMVIYIKCKFHETPSVGYLVMAEDEKIIEF